MYIYSYPRGLRVVPAPMGTIAENDVTATASSTNLSRLALGVALGMVAWGVYRKMSGKTFVPNALPPWPGIGPVPPLHLGPAFWLGQSVLW